MMTENSLIREKTTGMNRRKLLMLKEFSPAAGDSVSITGIFHILSLRLLLQ